MGELRHTCICLCLRCEGLGAGAFGVQPDGAEPLQVQVTRADELPVGILQATPISQGGDEQRL